MSWRFMRTEEVDNRLRELLSRRTSRQAAEWRNHRSYACRSASRRGAGGNRFRRKLGARLRRAIDRHMR